MTCVPSLASLENLRLCYYTARVCGATFMTFLFQPGSPIWPLGRFAILQPASIRARITFNRLQLSDAAAASDEDECEDLDDF